MNIGTSLKTISKNQLCSFIGTGGYVELAENDVLSDGSLVTAVAVLPLLNSRNDKGDGILPPGYQKMEFLETSGTQYISFLNPGMTAQTDWELKYQDYGNRYNNLLLGFMGGNSWQFFENYAHAYRSIVVKTPKHGHLTGPRTNKEVHVLSYTGNPQRLYRDGSSALSFVDDSALGSHVYILGYAALKSAQVRMFYVKLGVLSDLIPALDLDGTPCMFDTVKKQPFYNKGTGAFRVGIATLQQVRELQLPDNTGNAVRTLYVSLPQEARTDFTAQKHLSDLASLNWSINTQYRDGDVPADYTKVDFLESTGTQYINTGIDGGDDALIIEGRMSRKQTGSYLGFFGNYINEGINTTRLITNHISDAGLGLYAYLNIKAANALFVVSGDYTKTFDFSMTSNQFVFNGITFQRRTESVSGTPNNAPINLFKAYASPGPEVSSNVLCYFFKISNADETLVHLIPAINPNGVPGMWDKVSKQFFENVGTGAFIAGIKTLNDARMLNNALPVVPSGSTYSITLSLPVEASTDAPAQKALQDLAARGWSINVQYREDEIPAGYAKVSFLESSASQWIDTGFIPNGNTRFRVDCKSGWNNTCVFFCAEDSWRKVAFGLSNLYIYNIFEVRYNNTVYSFPQYLTLDRFVAEFSGDVVTINGTQVATIPYQDYSCNYTLFLFANHRGGYSSDVHYVIIYSAKFWDQSTGEAIRDFIPVINTAGVPGMWDRVNKQFYENAGTGQFRVGLASKEAVRNLYLEPNVPAGTTINLSVPAGTTNEDTNILKANNPNYTFNIRYRS